MSSPLHRPGSHHSAELHVSGAAIYVDDLPAPPGMLVCGIVESPHAHARVLRRDAAAAREVEGVVAVLFAEDIPGGVCIGPIVHDEPVLAEDEVHFCGQAVALVCGETYEAVRAGMELVEVDYEVLDATLSISAAIEAGEFLTELHVIERGDLEAAMATAELRLSGETSSGGQDHFYLETQAALALIEEGGLRVLASTQHPTEIQKMVAHVLGWPQARVTCEVPRVGGGFGGKESQATNYGVLAALGAWKTGRPVKVWLPRDTDMRVTGGRHPFWTRWEAGFSGDGTLVALRAELFGDGGWVADLSTAIMDRALFHADNAYFIEHLRLEGRVCRTNKKSNTAFRGFGGPQGVVVVEDIMERAATALGLDPAELRRRNFYGEAPRDRAPYGQRIPAEFNRLDRIWEELSESSDYAKRREAIDAFNAQSRFTRRGLGVVPLKFGISFTASLLNQAGALVLVYTDGTVQLSHGGTEMGQGLYTKMIAICAHSFGLPASSIRHMPTRTDKVPNTSPTAASSGSDLNGQAVRLACEAVRERMSAVAAELLDCAPSELRFADGQVSGPSSSLAFAELATTCWVRQVSLSSMGFYATPGVGYDHASGRGTPFFYYAYGMAVSEVEVCGLTGEHRVRRVDVLQDVGDSLIPTIDRGQVEGGFVQGMGWLTGEELLFDDSGACITIGPSTYKVPAVGDVPEEFNVKLLQGAPRPGVVHGSKAVGEPPFLLAISVVNALRHAIASFGPGEVSLALPATPEAILRAVEARRGPHPQGAC